MLSSELLLILSLLLLTVDIIFYVSCAEVKKSDVCDGEKQMVVETDEQTFETDLKNFIEHGVRTDEFNKILNYMHDDGFFKKSSANDARFVIPSLKCIVCRGMLGYLIGRRRLGDSRDNLARTIIMICRLATSFSQEVCEGFINLNIDIALYILDSRPKINQISLCALLLQPSCGELDESLDFHLEIAPAPVNPSPLKSQYSSSTATIKIIQFSDIHFDPMYVVGGNANCNDPLCCRKTTSENVNNEAGYWGDYRKCDMPWHSVEQAMKYMIRQHPDADFVYYTGDFVPHNVWETNIDGNVMIMDRMYGLMKETFGNNAIYPIIGNHEASTWSHWLPSSTHQTILKGGYYTVLIRPGFRIIALNNNACYIYNWWLHYNIDDIVEQLQWLHDTLLDAESNNEKIHILAHIASGDGSCFSYWAREYRRVVERFNGIIKAQFNGHSHYNEFNVFYETKNVSNPISVAWNGGSVTTYYDVNPNYNVYYVDGENFHVNDYESWIFNLTEANQNPSTDPSWYKQYSFKNDFKIPDLSPKSLDNLLTSMIEIRSKAQKCFQYKIKNGDPFLKTGCDDDCLRKNVCEISINEVGDDRRCKELLKNSFTSD